ncbi:bromodomain protein [Aphelenchoides avenae]|nr:bromodomain protein [Aphelenchus avenae]
MNFDDQLKEVVMNSQPLENPTSPKAWQADISPDTRDHLVCKFVKAAYPSASPQDIHHQPIKDLISYARQVENDCFLRAESNEEYYHLLAEEIYRMQRALEEQNRIREQNRQQEE